MKTGLLLSTFAVCLAMLATSPPAFAQEDEQTTVHITIKEDGKVTTDTTFELKEGQDPDMVKKMVEHLAGGDASMKKEVIIMKEGDEDCDHKALAWVHVDDEDDEVWHIRSNSMDINLDSLKAAHGGGKVMVFKDEDGNVTVKEFESDEDHEIHLEHKGHGDHEIMIIESDEEGENIQVKKIKKGGGHVMIVTEDEDLEWTDEEGGNVKVYVMETDDGKDVKVIKKKIKVEVAEGSDTDIEKEVEVEVKKEKKRKKK